MSRMTSAFRITRLPNFSPDTRTNLPPFAVWPAFPTADYYGGSVAMRVAPCRPSRVPPTVDVTGWFRRPFRILEAAIGSPVEALECSGPGTVEPEPSVFSAELADQRFQGHVGLQPSFPTR